jgi:hypothetical protein
LPISPVDAISPAFHHTKQQLLQPFRLAQWAKVALVGLLAGELSSGGCSSPNFQGFSRPIGSQRFLGMGLPTANPMLYAGLIAAVIVAGMVLFVLLLYISSVMRFVLFDSVAAKRCEIGQGWHRRQRPGMRYFLWQLLFSFVTMATLAILIGVPAAFAFALGWLKNANQHVIPLVLGGIALFFLLLAWLLLSVVIRVLTKDFVVPQMALEDLGAIEAWRRLLPMILAEKGAYAGYLGMKIVMALGAAMILSIVATILILIILIPVGGIGVVAVLAGKSAGLTWNLYTISLTVIVGSIALAAIVYLIALISVPATVFFPAYSIYFFAERYPALSQLLFPSAAPVNVPVALPPLPPNLDPIG